MAVQPYAIIATVATTITNPDGTTSSVAPGYVLNVVLWDGDTSIWSPPAGTEARADPTGTLQIGQTTTV
jgi:hypothetical protein